MAYSINPILHHLTDKTGYKKLQILVIYNRMKCISPTDVKLLPDQWDGKVINHPHKIKFNALIQKTITDIEGRLLERLRDGELNKDEFTAAVKGAEKKESRTILSYVEKLCTSLKGKFSEGRIKHIKATGKKIDDFKPDITFDRVNIKFLEQFETHLRSKNLEGNTINTNMKIFKSILSKAARAHLVNKSQFEDYRVPPYEQKKPEYLSEAELSKLHDFVKLIEQPGHRMAGYYFLLSCYAGYRIGDAKRFDYEKTVQDGMIVLRTSKNKRIVSIPAHTRLKDILEFIKTTPLSISEPKTRQYVKEIAAMVGIKKHVKFHTSRHTFAMLLRVNGFDIDEIAYFLGDSADVARIYGQMHDETLSKKIMSKLG